ncbi:MAG: hypothetical protein ABSC51_03055 [Gaiellaceae bacterium]
MKVKRVLVSIVAIAGALALAAAGGARTAASVLVYSCGPGYANLCQVNADGSGLKRLTTDGKAAPFAKRYISPSLSRDGRKLAYLRGYKLYVLSRATGHRTGAISNNAWLARISPDGTKVGDLEQFPSSSGSGWVMTACVFNSNGKGAKAGRNCEGSTGSFGFTGNNRVLASVSDQYDPKYGRYEDGVCLLDPVTSGCDKFVAAQLGYDLSDPALSPNGKLLAVTRSLPGKPEGQIALYGYATGTLVRTLTNGTTDAGPVWSPDGSKLAFVRAAKSIYTVKVSGGAPRRLVASGRAVTWGR